MAEVGGGWLVRGAGLMIFCAEIYAGDLNCLAGARRRPPFASVQMEGPRGAPSDARISPYWVRERLCSFAGLGQVYNAFGRRASPCLSPTAGRAFAGDNTAGGGRELLGRNIHAPITPIVGHYRERWEPPSSHVRRRGEA